MQPRGQELFPGARTFGWLLMGFSAVMIVGVIAVATWDGIRGGYSFAQFFARALIILTV